MTEKLFLPFDEVAGDGFQSIGAAAVEPERRTYGSGHNLGLFVAAVLAQQLGHGQQLLRNLVACPL